MYFAATCLHPYYKNYCENSWRDKLDWLEANDARLQQLWALYKPQEPYGVVEVKEMDELERWRRFELRWTQGQFEQGGNPISYWVSLRPKYPNLARMAIDVLTVGCGEQQ